MPAKVAVSVDRSGIHAPSVVRPGVTTFTVSSRTGKTQTMQVARLNPGVTSAKIRRDLVAGNLAAIFREVSGGGGLSHIGRFTGRAWTTLLTPGNYLLVDDRAPRPVRSRGSTGSVEPAGPASRTQATRRRPRCGRQRCSSRSSPRSARAQVKRRPPAARRLPATPPQPRYDSQSSSARTPGSTSAAAARAPVTPRPLRPPAEGREGGRPHRRLVPPHRNGDSRRGVHNDLLSPRRDRRGTVAEHAADEQGRRDHRRNRIYRNARGEVGVTEFSPTRGAAVFVLAGVKTSP